MKHLNLIFNLLLFPFLFVGAYLGKLFAFRAEGIDYHYHLTPLHQKDMYAFNYY